MAGRIPQQFIDDLINRIDIVEVIDSRIQLKKAGREYTACCPFHNEKTPSFTVSPAKQFYHCFGCGAHGTALGFLMDYEHMDFVEAVEELARTLGLEVPREAAAAGTAPDRSQPLYDIQARAARFYQQQLRNHPQAGRAIDYLKRRGLSGEIARDFGLGYAPPGWDNLLQALGDSETHRRQLLEAGLAIARDDGRLYDRFRDRILFPIHDRRGRVIGFGGRVLGDDTPKYLNSPETPVFHKGRELYGLYEARKAERKLERLLVVEGYMDVVALAQYGIRNAVATLGTATTREHLEQLYRIVPEVVFCFDGDRAGRAAAWRAAENALPVLRDGRQARFLFLPEGEDPDSLVRQVGREAFEARIGDSVPFSEFFFEHLQAGVDIQSMDGRARLVELARPLLNKLPAGVLRDLMTARLAELTRMDPGRLEQRLGMAEAPASRPDTPRPAAPQGGQRHSAVRDAIQLLLHEPALAARVEERTTLAGVDLAGVEILVELLELLRARPHLRNVGAILEHFREHPAERHLWKLARSEPISPPDGRAEEFDGHIRLILKQAGEARWRQLQAKLDRDGRLPPEELAEWKTLVRDRARPTPTAAKE
ncbi:DNA primase [Thiohalobacter sp. IOR34]|uniref:DNA primase n=1 Tax=Thiohalobacter sp. IOR34 TaxID=3057176 RepID=UPI0025AF63A2|nr:DNA primase [Thiohalobacter sp. IOR34]WJW75377.1 DNA primase [Thiohalobacter sp. IOR34]